MNDANVLNFERIATPIVNQKVRQMWEVLGLEPSLQHASGAEVAVNFVEVLFRDGLVDFCSKHDVNEIPLGAINLHLATALYNVNKDKPIPLDEAAFNLAVMIIDVFTLETSNALEFLRSNDEAELAKAEAVFALANHVIIKPQGLRQSKGLNIGPKYPLVSRLVAVTTIGTTVILAGVGSAAAVDNVPASGSSVSSIVVFAAEPNGTVIKTTQYAETAPFSATSIPVLVSKPDLGIPLPANPNTPVSPSLAPQETVSADSIPSAVAAMSQATAPAPNTAAENALAAKNVIPTLRGDVQDMLIKYTQALQEGTLNVLASNPDDPIFGAKDPFNPNQVLPKPLPSEQNKQLQAEVELIKGILAGNPIVMQFVIDYLAQHPLDDISTQAIDAAVANPMATPGEADLTEIQKRCLMTLMHKMSGPLIGLAIADKNAADSAFADYLKIKNTPHGNDGSTPNTTTPALTTPEAPARDMNQLKSIAESFTVTPDLDTKINNLTWLPVDDRALFKELLTTAVRNSVDSGTNPAVVLSQSILESGAKHNGAWTLWGSKLARDGNNFFGIKAGSDWNGDVIHMMTREVIDGQDTYVTAKFKKYATPSDGLMDYMYHVVNKSWYADARAWPDTPALYVSGLVNDIDPVTGATIRSQGEKGVLSYATDLNYVNSVLSVMNDRGIDQIVPAAFLLAAPTLIPRPTVLFNPSQTTYNFDRYKDNTSYIIKDAVNILERGNDFVKKTNAYIQTGDSSAFKSLCPGNGKKACDYRCDQIASHIVLDTQNSGYQTAYDHRQYFKGLGQLHDGNDKFNIPIGAYVFWGAVAPGHTAVYAGNGMVYSTSIEDKKDGVIGGIYLAPMTDIDAQWYGIDGHGYTGWAAATQASLQLISS